MHKLSGACWLQLAVDNKPLNERHWISYFTGGYLNLREKYSFGGWNAGLQHRKWRWPRSWWRNHREDTRASGPKHSLLMDQLAIVDISIGFGWAYFSLSSIWGLGRPEMTQQRSTLVSTSPLSQSGLDKHYSASRSIPEVVNTDKPPRWWTDQEQDPFKVLRFSIRPKLDGWWVGAVFYICSQRGHCLTTYRAEREYRSKLLMQYWQREVSTNAFLHTLQALAKQKYPERDPEFLQTCAGGRVCRDFCTYTHWGNKPAFWTQHASHGHHNPPQPYY